MEDLSKLTAGELGERESQIRREIMELRFEHATGKMLDTAKMGRTRKNLARVLTRVNAQKRS